MTTCRHNHPDEVVCGHKIAIEAAEIIRDCRTDAEAAAVAVEAMRQMLAVTGTTRGLATTKPKSFAGVAADAAAAKSMP